MSSTRTPDVRRPRALNRSSGPRRAEVVRDLGQTAIVAVLAVTLIVGIIGGVLVATVVQTAPLQAQTQVNVLAHRALEAGENAYVTAINANPSLAQCDTNTNTLGTCSGINYGQWNKVAESDAQGYNGDAEYYAFGNPQPTFDPTTKSLTNLAVQVVGAAESNQTHNNYVFDTETINLSSTNGFLTHVWWSNFESYSQTGDYSNCSYNWKEGYNAANNDGGCGPVYFASGDYLFGPTYTNDSVFVSSDGGGPSFGNGGVSPNVPSAVETADPACLFVDNNNGMNGNHNTCTNANGAVALYDTVNSSYDNALETPPQSNTELKQVAENYGCLYTGPTQITLSTIVVNGVNVGQMTITSPDTQEHTESDNGTPVPWDTLNEPTNFNDCPDNGTAPLPANGVVYVENNTGVVDNLGNPSVTQPGANPFDDYLANSVTNVTASPSSPTAGHAVTLTATVTSSVAPINTGATVSFSQTTSTTTNGHTTTNTSTISGCTAQANWSTPVQNGSTWSATATCSTTESNNGTGAFSATYSGGTYVNTSQGNLGQTNTLTPGVTPGGELADLGGRLQRLLLRRTGSPDDEGDAFVNGNLSGELTIGSQNNVVIDGSVTYADCSNQWKIGQSGEKDYCPYSVAGPNDSLGLIANEYVEVNHPVTNANGSVLPSCNGSPGALDAATPCGRSTTPPPPASPSTRPSWPSTSRSWSTTTAPGGTRGSWPSTDPSSSTHAVRWGPSTAVASPPATSSTTRGIPCSTTSRPRATSSPRRRRGTSRR